MQQRTKPDAYQALIKGFEQNHVFAHLRPAELYGKWLEATWAFLEAPSDPQGFRARLDKYSQAEGAEFGRLLMVYVDAVEDAPFRDVLGELFMRLDGHAAWNGQVFTPWEVAEMMARMQFDRKHFEELVRRQGEVRVLDPAVGSGVLLLAFAKVVYDELGRWGLSQLRLYGTDIDRRCVLMCRIQLRLNGLDAVGRLAGLLAAGAQQAAGSVPVRGLLLPAETAASEPAVLLRARHGNDQLALF